MRLPLGEAVGIQAGAWSVATQSEACHHAILMPHPQHSCAVTMASEFQSTMPVEKLSTAAWAHKSRPEALQQALVPHRMSYAANISKGASPEQVQAQLHQLKIRNHASADLSRRHAE